MFKRWIGGNCVSMDVALAASSLTSTMANNGQKNVLSPSGWGGGVPKSMREEAH